MIDTLITLGSLAWIGFCVMQVVKAVSTARRGTATLKADLAQLQEDAVNQIAMEGEGRFGVVYLFEQGSGLFVCQGKTLDEINDNFKMRHPHKRGAIIDFDAVAKEILHEDLLIEDDFHAGRA